MMASLATLVFCAPGYPGAAGDAQPYVDQFAKAAAASAHWSAGSLAAVYDPTEEGGLKKLGDPEAVLAFVPFPFFVQHGAELHLMPLAQADMVDIGPTERWTLVAKTRRGVGPARWPGYTLVSVAGYASEFVRRYALGSRSLPADVKIEYTGQILSALRRVAAGEKVVALLDQTQAAALATLPFAAQLKPIAQSAPLPVALLATVGSRLPAARVRALQEGLLKLGEVGSADALAPLHLRGFVPPGLPAQSKTAP